MIVKRALLLTCIVALAGCSEDPAATAQKDVASELTNALAHLANATAGSIGDKDFPGTLDEYRASQLEAAAGVLKPLIGKGSSGQQVVSRAALAEVYSTRARAQLRSASGHWADLAPRRVEVISAVVALRHNIALATAYRKVDPLTKADWFRQKGQELTARSGELRTEIDSLEQQVSQLTARHDDLRTESQAKTDLASVRTRQAFDTSGQEQFDLLNEAAEATRQSDQLTAEADKLTAKLNELQSQLTVSKGELDGVDRQTKAVTEAVQTLRARRDEAVSTAKQIEQGQADETGAAITPGVRGLVANAAARYEAMAAAQADKVAKALDAAEAELQAAVDLFGGGANATSAKADVLAEAGHITRQRAIILQTYRDCLAGLVEQLDGGGAGLAVDDEQGAAAVSKLAASISAAAEAAAQQAEGATAAAKQRLTDAAAALAPIVTKLPTRTKLDKDVKAAGYTRLIGLHEALAALTGDQAHIDQVDQLRQAMQELRTPAAVEE